MQSRFLWVLGTASLAVALGGCGSMKTTPQKADETVGQQESDTEKQRREQQAEQEQQAAREQAEQEQRAAREQAEREAEEQGKEAPVAEGQGKEAPAEAPASDRDFEREWFVSPSGSDQAEGSREKPFKTINRAIAAAGPGDAIRVQAGVYAENVVIDDKAQKGRKDAPITLMGEGKPKIVPGKASGTLLQVRRPYWIVEGFEVDVGGQPRFAAAFEGDTQGSALRNSDLHGGKLGAGVSTHANARGVLIEGNTIHHFARPGQDSHGVVIQATSQDIVVRNNDIHDTSGDAVQCLNPDSPAKKPAEGVVIEANRLHSTGENAVDIKTCKDVTVRRNTMSDFRKSPTSGGEAVVVHVGAEDVKIEDNNISKAGKGIAVGGVGKQPTGVVVKGNTIRDITTAGGSDGSGIRVENARKVQLEGNTIENTQGYGMMLGLGANGAPSEDLEVKDNVIRTDKLVRLGRQRPRLQMNSNRYSSGGMFKAEPKETRDFAQWKQLSGVDQNSSME